MGKETRRREARKRKRTGSRENVREGWKKGEGETKGRKKQMTDEGNRRKSELKKG